MIVEKNNEDLIKACKIAAEVRDYGASLIKPGVKLLEVIEKVEKKIIELGGEIAFPPQISLNHIAAHYCPDYDDKIIFKDQICKIDVGVHVNGFIGDTAKTVDLSGKYTKLVEASRKALENAVKIIKPGITLGEVGRTIQKTIESYGFTPIRNLSGHGLGKYEVHTPPSIPNFDTGDKTQLKKGQLIAIEPFATTGAGMVQDSNYPTLFSLMQIKPVRLPATRKVLKFIIANYKELVFTKRWLRKSFKPYELEFALRDLTRNNILIAYPPLGEKAKGIVSQAEFTLIVDSPSVILTP